MGNQDLTEMFLLVVPLLLIWLTLLVAGLFDLLCPYSARRFGRLLLSWNAVRMAEASVF